MTNPSKPLLNDLDFKDLIHLFLIAKGFKPSSSGFMKIKHNFSNPLTPHHSLTEKIIDDLQLKGFISPYFDFEKLKNDNIIRNIKQQNIYEGIWKLNFFSYHELLTEIVVKKKCFYKNNHDLSMLMNIRDELLVYECVAYYQYLTIENGLEVNENEQICNVFSDLADEFSLSKIFCMSWYSIKIALNKYGKNIISLNEILSEFEKNLTNYVEKVHLHDRAVSDYSRPRALKRSIYSKLIDTTLMNIDRNSFNNSQLQIMKILKKRK